MTDTELRERLAPLRADEPTDAEIAAVLRAARPARPRRRRFALALVAATVIAATVVAALPGTTERPASAAALLRAAAAVAADQPAPPAFTGYRYTEVLERWHWRGLGESRLEQRVENWVDRRWEGRILAHRGTVGPGQRMDAMARGGERDFEYGDGGLARVPISELPTEPRALKALLEAAYRDLRWTPDSTSWAPGLPTDGQMQHDITRQVLLLLGTANTTPALRSALWGVLALMPGLRSAPDVRDPLGREGVAVTLPGGSTIVPVGTPPANHGNFTVVFDVENSEMLSWSLTGMGGGTPDQTHTFVRAAHVRNIGDRPGP